MTSKRDHLYKAMEEISDAHLEETAQIRMGNKALTSETDQQRFPFQRILWGTLAAAGVILLCFLATYNIWHQQNQEGDTEIQPAGTGSAATTVAASEQETSDTADIFWAVPDLTAADCVCVQGVLLKFENGTVMVELDNEGPTVISNREAFSEVLATFNTGMVVQLYLAPDAEIQETYPASVSIAGIGIKPVDEVEISEDDYEGLNSMGYVLTFE